MLGADGLAAAARDAARLQISRPSDARGRQAPLLTRLDDSRRVLADARDRIAAAADGDVDVGPTGEWLLDNFHVVDEHVRDVRESLPRDYYRELPTLAEGPLAGYPRVYEIATTLIGHTEARIDRANVDLFVAAFQEVAPLSIGELWAVPAMLRLGLVESVRGLAVHAVRRLNEIEAADRWAARLAASRARGVARRRLVRRRCSCRASCGRSDCPRTRPPSWPGSSRGWPTRGCGRTTRPRARTRDSR